jgi:hypothetical protein
VFCYSTQHLDARIEHTITPLPVSTLYMGGGLFQCNHEAGETHFTVTAERRCFVLRIRKAQIQISARAEVTEGSYGFSLSQKNAGIKS